MKLLVAILEFLDSLLDRAPDTEMELRRKARPDVGFDLKARQRTAEQHGLNI